MTLPDGNLMAIPREGVDADTLQGWLHEFARAEKEGPASLHFGKRFFCGDDVAALAESAYGLFGTVGRTLPYPGFDVHSNVGAMRSAVIGSVLSLMHAPPDAWGEFTAGGTESTILAMRTCLNRAIALGRERSDCEVIAASSVHPCFDKAADLLGLALKRVDVGADLLADAGRIAAQIGERTIMLIGSAPSYPYGLVDDIEALSAVAREHGLWLHVDACLSGMLAPFMEMNGALLPPFDFRTAGVDSISVDLHKHGYAAKGASLILYRSAEMAEFHRFRYSSHPFAPMTTTTLAGTAPAGPVASAWAVMQYLGITGYRRLANRLSMAVAAHVDEINGTQAFEVLGDPRFSIVCARARNDGVASTVSQLVARGWFVLEIADPPGIQINVGVDDGPLASALASQLQELG